jgi:hypothetical protein
MYHESNVRAATLASPVLSPAPSSATLSTQQWPPAAVPTESAQIANRHDRGEAPQSRKRLLASAALQIRVGFSPLPHSLHALTHLDAESGRQPPAGAAQGVKEDKATALCGRGRDRRHTERRTYSPRRQRSRRQDLT